MSRKKSKMSFVVASLLAVFLTVVAAYDSQAALQAVGPVGINGFPDWYQDTNGLQVQQCLLDPLFCIPDPVDPANPVSVAAGFNGEAFYWTADALITRPAPLTPAILVLALEQAWASADGNPAAGFESVFGRIRIRVPGLVPNTVYTITHPFATVDMTSDAVGVVNFTEDIGCFGLPVPGGACNFTLPLFSNIGPFLTAVAPPPPPGFLGNPGIDQTVTGSPTGNNLFSVTGPNVGGPGVDTISTDLFAVQGQVLGLLPRFQDVLNNHPFFTQIDAIAAAGITGGCSAGPPPLFCPDASITRAQMAVFIETSLGNGAPVACTGAMFTDVTPAQVGPGFCNFIEAFANRGITGGCVADDPGIPGNQARYCPNDPVTRGQMAVFIETALGNAPVTPCGTQFADVPATHPFCGFIQGLFNGGITGGCGGTNFCPNDPVTRGQMAVFIFTAPAPLLPDPLPPAPPAPPAP